MAFFEKARKNYNMKNINNYTNEPKMEVTEKVSVLDSATFPFKLLQRNDKVQILIGNSIISEKLFDHIEDAEQYINTKPWELIINIFCYTYEKLKNNETK